MQVVLRQLTETALNLLLSSSADPPSTSLPMGPPLLPPRPYPSQLWCATGVCVFCGRLPRCGSAGGCAVSPAGGPAPWIPHPPTPHLLLGAAWWRKAIHVPSPEGAAGLEAAGAADFDSLPEQPFAASACVASQKRCGANSWLVQPIKVRYHHCT